MHGFAVRLLMVTSLLSVSVQPSAGRPAEQEPAPPLRDRYGDPLPAGAVARLGSVRLRHPELTAFTLLPDGRTAVTVGRDQMVRRWDLETGCQTHAVKLRPNSSWPRMLALSPDGSTGATFDDSDK